MQNYEDRIATLLTSPKVRIDESSLRELIRSKEPSRNNILILIDNVAAIESRWRADPILQNIIIERTSAIPPFQTPPETAYLWQEGVPGPMIIGRFTFVQIERFVEWDEVLQIEQSEIIQPISGKETDEAQ